MEATEGPKASEPKVTTLAPAHSILFNRKQMSMIGWWWCWGVCVSRSNIFGETREVPVPCTNRASYKHCVVISNESEGTETKLIPKQPCHESDTFLAMFFCAAAAVSQMEKGVRGVNGFRGLGLEAQQDPLAVLKPAGHVGTCSKVTTNSDHNSRQQPGRQRRENGIII